MGDSPLKRNEELATIRMALDEGMSLIDTAEMYGDGRAESLVGKAIAGRRSDAFLVSKVLPQNASRKGTILACERSLHRLGTDSIDLYLLHWRGSVPLDATIEAFLELQRSGKIRSYGVSNLDLGDMQELWKAGGQGVATDQLLYNLCRRGIEWDLLPWLRERHIPVMAYSPLEQGRLLQDSKLASFARKHQRTPAQAALGWLLSMDGVIAIPKTSSRTRLEEIFQTCRRPLHADEISDLDQLFPPPSAPEDLAML
jgi:aldehyde reductase